MCVYCAGSSLDLSLAENTTVRLSTTCRTIYGFVVERHSRSNVTICGDQMNGLRGKHYESIQTIIHKSQANSLQIFVESDIADKFILRVEGKITLLTDFMMRTFKFALFYQRIVVQFIQYILCPFI